MITSTPNEYTEMLSRYMWDRVDDELEAEDDYESVVSLLKSTAFYPFSYRLLRFVNELWGASFDADQAAHELLRRGQHQNIPFNRNTVKAWFRGTTTPRKDEITRGNIYKIAFALELDIEQTSYLFNKVYLDRAFNLRNPIEFIYHSCISHKTPYGAAQSLAKQIVLDSSESDDSTILTTQLENDSTNAKNERLVLDYIKSHQHNFQKSDRTAHRVLDSLIEEAKELSSLELKLRKTELENGRESITKGRTIGSLDFLLAMIFDTFGKEFEFQKLDTTFTDEIAVNFPSKQTFSKSNPSSEMLRKEIILLAFYCYWAKVFINDMMPKHPKEALYVDFVEWLNLTLFECGFGKLYMGNPYDWLFLYCAGTGQGLDTFRGIMDMVMTGLNDS